MPDEIPSQPLLERIVDLAEKQRDILSDIENLQAQLKAKASALIAVAGGFGVEGALVSAMEEAGEGVDSLTLKSGHKVTISLILKCPSMAVDSPDREPTLTWCENNGLGDIIKDDIHIPFNKGDENVSKVLALIAELKLEYERYRTINAQTLKKTFNDMKKNGEALPFIELPGLQEYKVAKVELK